MDTYTNSRGFVKLPRSGYRLRPIQILHIRMTAQRELHNQRSISQ